MDQGVQFQVVFQMLAAVEGFSAWTGKSLIGDPVVDFDEGPKFDRKRFDGLCGQLGDFSQIGKTLWKMVRMYMVFKIVRMRYLFVCKGKRICMTLAKLVHNLLGFLLRWSPIVSVSFLAFCYIKKLWCDGDVISSKLLNAIAWFIVAKVSCYMLCAALNKLMVRDVSVKANAQNLMDINKKR